MSDMMQTDGETRGKTTGLALGAVALAWGVSAFVGQRFVPGPSAGVLGDQAWLFLAAIGALVVILSLVFAKMRSSGQGLAFGALMIALLSVGYVSLAALGSKWGLWHWTDGFAMLTSDWGGRVIFGAIGLSLTGLLVGAITPERVKPIILGVGAVLVASLLMGRLVGIGAGAAAVPPIHDYQTDWDDPVVLSDALVALRAAQAHEKDNINPVRYGEDAVFRDPSSEQFGGRLIKDIQEAAECSSSDVEKCEDDANPKPFSAIEPLLIDAPAGRVFEEAEKIVRKKGWVIVTADANAGIIEATYISKWWGFKDDIAIRIRDAGGDTTRVDMRSISRVGGSDLGANARRITSFLFDLDGQRYN